MSTPYFVRCKTPPYENQLCDDCGRKILDVGDGTRYWNVNKKATIVTICHECYDFRNKRRQERWDKRLRDLEDDKFDGGLIA